MINGRWFALLVEESIQNRIEWIFASCDLGIILGLTQTKILLFCSCILLLVFMICN